MVIREAAVQIAGGSPEALTTSRHVSGLAWAAWCATTIGTDAAMTRVRNSTGGTVAATMDATWGVAASAAWGVVRPGGGGS